MQSIPVFPEIAKFADFLRQKCWCQQNSRGVSSEWYIFWIFFMSGITLSSFIIVGYVWYFRKGGGAFLPPPHPWITPKMPILNSVNKVAGLRSATFIKRETLTQVFPVSFVKFLGTLFCVEHLWRLLLNF